MLSERKMIVFIDGVGGMEFLKFCVKFSKTEMLDVTYSDLINYCF